MRKSRHKNLSRHPRTVITTIGDLVTAAFDAAGGDGPERNERAAALLCSSPLARRLSRQLRFTR
jgi:class 3 adenylate cyclase